MLSTMSSVPTSRPARSRTRSHPAIRPVTVTAPPKNPLRTGTMASSRFCHLCAKIMSESSGATDTPQAMVKRFFSALSLRPCRASSNSARSVANSPTPFSICGKSS